MCQGIVVNRVKNERRFIPLGGRLFLPLNARIPKSRARSSHGSKNFDVENPPVRVRIIDSESYQLWYDSTVDPSSSKTYPWPVRVLASLSSRRKLGEETTGVGVYYFGTGS
jgi:hypothetical protein